MINSNGAQSRCMLEEEEEEEVQKVTPVALPNLFPISFYRSLAP
jgi:hypothetical protein